MLDGDGGAVPERMAFLTEAEIDAQAAMAALDLGRPTRAARMLDQAITAYDPRFARNVTLYRAWLAGAHAAAHDLDGAAEAITHTVQDLTTNVTSRRATAILDQVITEHQLAGRRNASALSEALTRYQAIRKRES
jgi:hypothetical protein